MSGRQAGTIDALVAEIGSTTTLVNAFSGLEGQPSFLGQSMAPTTALEGDVTIGLRLAIERLKTGLGAEDLAWQAFYASSSAAGGLSMSVHGLVYQVTAGRMGDFELGALQKLRPNLMLLAGGTDYGDRETAVHNARAIAGLRLGIPCVYAGNSQAAEEVSAIFAGENQPLSVIENVYPRLDELNIEPARRAIQDLFEIHIVKAPGMSNIRQMVGGTILPTPGAVMEAVRLLYPVLGDLLAVDIGGATTDVHAAAQGSEEIARIQTQPEPLFKRTVEGDLGTYLNARPMAEKIGFEALNRELGLDSQTILKDWPPVPETGEQALLAARLAREAGAQAISRHAGRMREVFLPEGRRRFAQGKDLSCAKTFIATGGALTRLPGRLNVLRHLRDLNQTGQLLYPKPGEMRVLTDSHYLLAALGTLSCVWPEAALQLMLSSLKEETL
jgi:uncharacterized protein (TIGR01319 family)